MHGSTRLPSRSGQARGQAVRNGTAAIRTPLFTPPPLSSAFDSVRLPSLATSGTQHTAHSARASMTGRNLQAEAAAAAARARYTSSLKRTARRTTGDAGPLSSSTRSSPTPPPAEPELLTPERPTKTESSPSPSPCSSPQATEVDPAAGVRAPSISALDGLLQRQRYAELYFVLSTLLPASARRVTRDDAQTMRVLGYRAICSAALLRFKESVEDGTASQSIRRRLREVGCVLASPSDQRCCAQMDECVMRALVMSERYAEAEQLMPTLATNFESIGDEKTAATPSPLSDTTPSAAFKPTASMWLDAIPRIRQFRVDVAEQNWNGALAALHDHDATHVCVRCSPLCAMLGFVHVEAGHPMTARALLLAYLATLPEPPSWESLVAAPPEHEQLWDSFRSHYVFSTTLLAKASVMSGSAFLNIAAALLQRCLRILPLYTPARLLAEFVLAYEAQQQALEAAMTRYDLLTALQISTRMLAMPELQRALRGEIYLARTQVQWLRRLPLEVVREASQCVAADPECALAFRLRADALEAMGHAAEAVADRVTAARLHSRVEAAFAELRSQQRSYEAAQRATAGASFASSSSTPPPRSFTGAGGHMSGSSPQQSSPSHPTTTSTAGAAPRRMYASTGFDGASTDAEAAQTKNFNALPRCTAMAGPTHYAVLGVAPHATMADIRHRYRQLTLQCHPDRLVDAADERRQQALEEFKRISNAYGVLSDAQQRAEYDATLRMPF